MIHPTQYCLWYSEEDTKPRVFVDFQVKGRSNLFWKQLESRGHSVRNLFYLFLTRKAFSEL